ncbi:MAG TPA: hypothetical protein ENI49_06080 [Thermoplasmatales archaeon]|nr:hypothetical protein [Thermoplasmatales archaeon]
MDQRGEKEIRVLKRLYFIRYLYDGDSVENASEKAGVIKTVGMNGYEDRTKEDTKGLYQILVEVDLQTNGGTKK